MINVALGVLAGVVAALVIGVFIRGRTRSVTIFCPVRGEVVDVRGDRCFAKDDGRIVGSAWDCQRECLDQLARSGSGADGLLQRLQ